MSTDDKSSPDLATLFGRARETEVPPPGVKDEVWKNIEAQIAAPAPVPVGAGPASAGAVRIAAITGFAAGVLSGIAGMFVALPMLVAPEIVYKEVPVEVPVPTIVVVAPTPPPAPTSVRVDPPPTSIEEPSELPWLAAARGALRDGRVEDAMKNLDIAREKYPDGKHAAQREALVIHVLIARGDRAGAETALEVFRRRHPKSSFTPVIEEAIRGMK